MCLSLFSFTELTNGCATLALSLDQLNCENLSLEKKNLVLVVKYHTTDIAILGEHSKQSAQQIPDEIDIFRRSHGQRPTCWWP